MSQAIVAPPAINRSSASNWSSGRRPICRASSRTHCCATTRTISGWPALPTPVPPPATRPPRRSRYPRPIPLRRKRIGMRPQEEGIRFRDTITVELRKIRRRPRDRRRCRRGKVEEESSSIRKPCCWMHRWRASWNWWWKRFNKWGNFFDWVYMQKKMTAVWLVDWFGTLLVEFLFDSSIDWLMDWLIDWSNWYITLKPSCVIL